MNLKDAMRKAASLLVETSDEAPPPPDSSTSSVDDLLATLDGDPSSTRGRTVHDIVNDTDGPSFADIAAQSSAPQGDNTMPLRADGSADVAAIYNALQVPSTSFSAEQMLEMLHSLPSELPLETRRQTVKVMLSTLGRGTGTTPEVIVADASRKIAALSACVDRWEHTTQEGEAQAEHEIAALEQQIADKRAKMETARAGVVQLKTSCEAEAAKLDDVLEFFSLDVAPSKYAPRGSDNI